MNGERERRKGGNKLGIKLERLSEAGREDKGAVDLDLAEGRDSREGTERINAGTLVTVWM